MFVFKHIYEHPEGISKIPDFSEEDYIYLLEVVWYADMHCISRSVEPTETGIMYKSVWKTKEDRDKVNGLFEPAQDIMRNRGKATIALGGTYNVETEEIPDEST